ncbi:unnamed protein product [Effrenium voratum]|nr:unnamed protein product [Effrenium voratum]
MHGTFDLGRRCRTLLIEADKCEDDLQIGADRGYTTEKMIGRGCFGIALLVRNREGQLRVMKAIEQGRSNEPAMMRNLRHPYIVRFRESFVDKGSLAIVMDFAGAGDLLHRVDAAKRATKGPLPLPEEKVVQWFAQALLGLNYLHGLCIIHRDIKSENLFLESEDHLRIGDFGLAKLMKKPTEIFIEQQIVGTPLYLSPEICAKGMYSAAGDVWALGCVLFELLSLSLPFEARNLPSLLVKITAVSSAPRPSCEHSQELVDTCVWLLTKSRTGRPTTAEVLQHPFLRPTVDSLEGRKCRREASKKRGSGVEAKSESPKVATGPYPQPLPSPLLRTHQAGLAQQARLAFKPSEPTPMNVPRKPQAMRTRPRSLSPEEPHSSLGACGSPQHWLRRSKSKLGFVGASQQSQPTLRLAEPLSAREILEAEVLPRQGPPRVRRSKSSNVLETRTPRAVERKRTVPPPLKLGKLKDGCRTPSACPDSAAPSSRRPPSAKSARAPSAGSRVASKEPHTSRGPCSARSGSARSARAPRNLRVALKQPDTKVPRGPASARSVGPAVPKGVPRKAVQPLLLRDAPPRKVPTRSPSAPPKAKAVAA